MEGETYSVLCTDKPPHLERTQSTEITMSLSTPTIILDRKDIPADPNAYVFKRTQKVNYNAYTSTMMR